MYQDTNRRSFGWHPCLGIVLILLAGTAAAQNPAWKPDRNVEIIVGTAAGSSIDVTARIMQRLLRETKLVDTTSTVVNKPGGGNAVGWTYLNQHKGDAHYISITAHNLLTNFLTGASPLSYQHVTPIAQLYTEYVAFLAQPQSTIRSGDDLIERLRKDPQSVNFAIASSRGNTNHIAIALVAKSAGVDVKRLKVVVFNSGGEATTALLGGHVDVVVTTITSSVGHVAAGKLRAVAVSSENRLGGAMAGSPTWKEQGVNGTFAGWRGVIGPSGLTPSQVAFWEDALERMVATESWKKELEQKLWGADFRKSAESRKLLEREAAELKVVLSELGLVK